MEKIVAVYKIVNTVTGDFYIGSSKNVKRRWAEHKCPSRWKQHPNIQFYKDIQKYGVDKFRFQILAPVMPEHLKQVEQEFIEMLQPTYNSFNAKGLDYERYKKAHRKAYKKYSKSEKGKDTRKKYDNQLCFYNGETLTLSALHKRFSKAGVEYPFIEAKKYLIKSK